MHLQKVGVENAGKKTALLTLTEIKCVFLSVGPETPGCYCLGAIQAAKEHIRNKRRENKWILKYVIKNSYKIKKKKKKTCSDNSENY